MSLRQGSVLQQQFSNYCLIGVLPFFFILCNSKYHWYFLQKVLRCLLEPILQNSMYFYQLLLDKIELDI